MCIPTSISLFTCYVVDYCITLFFFNLQDKEEVKSTSGPDKETDVKDKERLQTAKESSGALLLSQDALASDKPPLLETWVDLLNFTKCFQ